MMITARFGAILILSAHMIPIPALRRIRRVLIFVDITQVRRLMEEQFSDAMTVTSCTNLPDLRDSEDMAMFTYARLLKPSQIQTTTVGDLFAGISQDIDNTWGVNIDVDTMDLVGVIEQATPSLCAILTPSVVFYKRILGSGTRHWHLQDHLQQSHTIHLSNSAVYQ
jgi:hypothetical protein